VTKETIRFDWIVIPAPPAERPALIVGKSRPSGGGNPALFKEELDPRFRGGDERSGWIRLSRHSRASGRTAGSLLERAALRAAGIQHFKKKNCASSPRMGRVMTVDAAVRLMKA
jgi:hypothetical protein